MITPSDIARDRETCSAATVGPWEFRATEHSGGIRFVVAPNQRRNENGTEFIPADCSHGFNGRFIAAARSRWPLYIAEVESLQTREQNYLATIGEATKRVKNLEAELKRAEKVVEAARYMTCQEHLKPKRKCCYCDVDLALAEYDRRGEG